MRFVLTLLAALLLLPQVAAAGTVSTRFTASDGVSLQTTLTRTSTQPAPTIVEFSPYGRSSTTFNAGADFNHLLVQVRGTGDSDGRFDAFGPRMQRDVAEVLGWACRQPWSDGRLGLNGFSASAIAIYNSLHLELPCVKGAVLKSGTFELYRDLLTPGGVSNLVPGAVVLAGISGISLAQGADRVQRDAASGLEVALGDLSTGLEVLNRPTLDTWWRERGFRGDVNDLPILMVAGFFDVEARGAFQGFQELRDDGAHMIVIGAHDAPPRGTDGGASEMRAWLDHHVRGADNGVEQHPRVQMWLADGNRKTYTAGRFVRRDANDWPVPGTTWRSYWLDAGGTLKATRPSAQGTAAYATIPSLPTSADVPNAAIIDGAGASAVTDTIPILNDMTLSEQLGLTFTTAPLTKDLVSAGPGALEIGLSTTAPGAPIWAVVSDVSPDGTAHPLTVGRLSTDFPEIDRTKSLVDQNGDVVQPYGRFDKKSPATPGATRRYHVELWPLGNRFRAGHRIRLHLVGPSLASAPGLPGVNTVRTGPGSRLLVPEIGDPAAKRRARGQRPPVRPGGQ